MDPILLGSTMTRRSWFLARSDVFRKKAMAKALGFIGIIPIYRLQEGAENLSKNDETFDKCSAMLNENKAIMIFSEGLCVQERRLRKLKKGTARIALGTEEKHDFKMGVKIVPAGLNYSATPWKFRSSLSIHYGEPFEVKQYEALYRENKAKAINQFTNDLEVRMRELLITIEHKVNDELVAHLEELLFATRARELHLNVKDPLQMHEITKEITTVVNAFENSSPHQCKEFRHDVKVYIDEIKKR
jgi:1-acyl-sn-glycerol-3-phosphate acyltransferase